MTCVVYKLPCKDCDFVYTMAKHRGTQDKIKRTPKSLFREQPNSKVAQHANEESHSFDFADIISIVDKEKDWRKRIFLEAWHSITDPKAGNERIQIASMYKY